MPISPACWSHDRCASVWNITPPAKIEQAISAYQLGLAAAAGNQSSGHVTVEAIAELHAKPPQMNACQRENKAKLSVSCRKVVEARGG